MAQQREGLNYVPMLTQSLTPPSSGRSRLSLNRNRSYRPVAYYNGNYEGDSSMFREKRFELERLSLADSESDAEDLSGHISAVESKRPLPETKSFIWRLVEFLVINYLKPKLSEKTLLRCAYFQQSSVCRLLTNCLQVFALAMTYSFRWSLVLAENLAALSRFFWNQRIIFHNLVRRLLWRLTLAKCSERLLFFGVLLSLPLLFALSLIGFIISICGGLKDLLSYGVHALNRIKLN